MWAFNICDKDRIGSITKPDLYAGMLLVHLTCAKFAGPAACFPPSRKEVERLFEVIDEHKTGRISLDQFNCVMMILCTNITTRILSYYTVLMVFVPHLASGVLAVLNYIRMDDFILGIDSAFDSLAPSFLTKIVDLVPDQIWLRLPEQIISLSMFFLVIPYIMTMIEQNTYKSASRAIVMKDAIRNKQSKSVTA